MDASEALVSFAAETKLDAIPENVKRRAKLAILDAIGTSALSTTLDKSKRTIRAIRRVSSGGKATVWASGLRASPLEAALLNGMLAEALDYSDIHLGGGLHPTSVVLPAAVASAEMTGKSGADVLLSHIIGCESMIRLGKSAPGRFHARGFQPTSVTGVLGACLAAGRMFGLKHDEMTEDLSLATILAFGSSLSVRVGSYFGGVDSGRAAESGLLAAVLAREGVRGIADDSIEGRFGFLETHVGRDSYDSSRITKGLGKTWETKDIFLKRYPTSFAFTYMLDAAIRLKAREGFDPSEVEEVRFGEDAPNISSFSEPEEVKRRPADIYVGKTSHYYTLALALTHGAVTAELLQRGLKDPKIRSLSDKVTYQVDDKSHWVEVKLKDGRVLLETQDTLDPSPESLIRKKYLANATPVLGATRAKKVESLVDSLERVKSVRELTKLIG